MTPWGYLQLNPNKQMEDMPFIDILAAAGLYYTDGYCVHGGHFRYWWFFTFHEPFIRECPSIRKNKLVYEKKNARRDTREME